MMERAAAQSVVSAGQVPEDVFWFATQVSSLCILPLPGATCAEDQPPLAMNGPA